jgi:two-component system LytT family response regulator
MTAVAPIRVLVVDDEPLAREGVVLLARREPDLEVVGECGSTGEAERAIRSLSPDVVFLDVQLPGESGLDLAARLDRATAPLIICVTAHEEHAVRAFELHAVDYLLKPIDPDRFSEAVRRARHALAAGTREEVRERLLSALELVRGGSGDRGVLPSRPEADSAEGVRYLERLSVRIGDTLVVVRLADVDWIAADGDYMRLHVGGKSSLVRMTMAQLERKLDPRRFLRVHRSAIVNLDAVRSVEVGVHGDYVLRLRDGSRVKLSRSYRDAVLAALGAAL